MVLRQYNQIPSAPKPVNKFSQGNYRSTKYLADLQDYYKDIPYDFSYHIMKHFCQELKNPPDHVDNTFEMVVKIVYHITFHYSTFFLRMGEDHTCNTI
jgi:hypothetical protein